MRPRLFCAKIVLQKTRQKSGGYEMLNLAYRNTAKLVRAFVERENVRLGRLFTKKDTARRMAKMFSLDTQKNACTILDPGAGTGILAAALIERICKEAKKCKQIFLTCYENENAFLPMLRDNLERIRKKCRHDYDVRLFVTVYEENYITCSKEHYTVHFFRRVEDTFDYIICNPPKELYEKGSEEASAIGGISTVKAHSALLFAETAKRHLEEGGQLVIVMPTTIASATEQRPFRLSLFGSMPLTGVHLFVGKQKNTRRAIPLKKECILAMRKGEAPETVKIYTSADLGAKTEALAPLRYDFVVDKDGRGLTLPKSAEDANIVLFISNFPETLESLGLRMRTGLVLDSRSGGMLFNDPVKGTIPLLRPAAIENGIVQFPAAVPKQYIAPLTEALIQPNKNMLLIKRVPAKRDERFLNAGIYLAARLPTYRFISTHNKLNFIDTKEKGAEICARLLFGLFALLNSTIYDRYISIVSKSNQINAKEFKNLPMPPRNLIENIGMRLQEMRATDVQTCDKIVNPTFHIREK